MSDTGKAVNAAHFTVTATRRLLLRILDEVATEILLRGVFDLAGPHDQPLEASLVHRHVLLIPLCGIQRQHSLGPSFLLRPRLLHSTQGQFCLELLKNRLLEIGFAEVSAR